MIESNDEFAVTVMVSFRVEKTQKNSFTEEFI